MVHDYQKKLRIPTFLIFYVCVAPPYKKSSPFEKKKIRHRKVENLFSHNGQPFSPQKQIKNY